MKAVEFVGQNLELLPPQGWDNAGRHKCGNLPILAAREDGLTFLFSVWKPDAEDLKRLNAGGYVRLQIVSDRHPPVALSTLLKADVEELP